MCRCDFFDDSSAQKSAHSKMYRNGSRLIPPALQENIRDLFRENRWTEEVQFDSYVEDYDW